MLAAIFITALINLDTISGNEALSAQVQNAAVTPSETEEEFTNIVEVSHKQRGILLALIPITFQAKAIADARGNIKIIYPWYSKLSLDKKEEVETNARVAVDNALKAGAVGTVKAQGENAAPKFSPKQAEAVEKALLKVLKNAFEEMDALD